MITYTSTPESTVAPLYNEYIEDATEVYLNAEPTDLSPLNRKAWREEHPKVSIGSLTHEEFLEAVLSSPRQSMNPVSLTRDALGYSEDATEEEISTGLRLAYGNLIELYMDNGLDPSPLSMAWEMISLTEAYIAGYSRDIGGVALRLQRHDKGLNALERWNSQLWVPDEDMHDRTLSFAMTSAGIVNQEEYFRKHIRHMKIGTHVDLSNVITVNGYVTLQEDATVISYQNLAIIFGEVFGRIFSAIAENEAQHKRAYRSILLTLSNAFPDDSVISLLHNCESFEMPGIEGIEGYEQLAKALGYLGMLDPQAVIDSQSKIFESMDLAQMRLQSDEAKIARDTLLDNSSMPLQKRKRLARLVQISRLRDVERAAVKNDVLPIVIGTTVFRESRNGPLLFPFSFN